MSSSHYSLLIFLIAFSACVATGQSYYILKLSVLRQTFIQDPTWVVRAKDFQTFFYNQTLDHFNYRPESYTLFKQKYLINFKYWGGANASAPILVYLGAEAAIDGHIGGVGFLMDNAAHFRALLVYIEEASFSCHQTIRQSWEEIDRVAFEPHGLTKLSKTFKTCSPLQSSSELKNNLIGIYAGAAQYNDPFRRPVEAICNAIDGASPKNDILKKIFAGLVASNGNLTCYVNPPSSPPSQTDLGWHWQSLCSLMVEQE
ncbi:hypothetical protein NL676_004809 [Syzygium grande]|nr:hypothetical protein NL676_004809 [Syzygium grande]